MLQRKGQTSCSSELFLEHHVHLHHVDDTCASAVAGIVIDYAFITVVLSLQLCMRYVYKKQSRGASPAPSASNMDSRAAISIREYSLAHAG